MISRAIRYHQLPGTISTMSAGETVIVNLRTGRFYGLPATAGLVWAAVAEPRTPIEIIDAVLRQTAHVPLAAAVELSTFLTLLQEEGLVVPAPTEISAHEPPPMAYPEAPLPYVTPRLDRGTLSAAANGLTGANDGATLTSDTLSS